MKKKCPFISPPTLKVWLKALFVMKFFVFFIFISALQVSAKTNAQKISVHFNKTKLAEALREVERKTDYRFVFSNMVLSDAIKVTVRSNEIAVPDLLKLMLNSTGFTYKEITDKLIAITFIGNSYTTDLIIKGTVTDVKGNPIPNVSVAVKNGTGTTTNDSGYYVVEADPAATLVFSVIGYTTQEVKVNSRATINVRMIESASELGGVVVLGYGTRTTAIKNSSSVATLQGDRLVNLPLPTVGDGLAGRVAGLLVTSSGGGPGKVPTISIRGGGTPVYVIDNIISTEFDFRTLNVTDIESISFLKDAAATGIYGLVAGNGVVLVTTKKGVTGKMSVRYDFGFDLSQPTILPHKLNSYDKAVATNQVYANEGLPQAYTNDQVQKYQNQSDPLNYPNTNWQKLALRNFAPESRHNVTLTGGDKKFQYYGSVGYFDQGTLFKFNTNSLKRYNYRLSVTGNFDKVGIKTSLSIYGVNEDYLEPNSQYGEGYYYIWGHIQNRSPMELAYSDLAHTKYSNQGDNPLVEMDPRSGYGKTQNHNTNGLLNVQWDIPGVRGWDVKVNANFRQNQSWNKYWQTTAPQYAIGSDVQAQQSPQSLSQNASNGYEYTLQALTDYNRTFLKDHTISALLGYEEYYSYSDNFSASRNGYLLNVDQLFAGPNSTAQNNGSAAELAREAVLGHLKYDFKGRYIAEGSFRYDGNGNLFPKNKRWGFFPSGSLAWVISKERFMKDLDNKGILNTLKYRISYGVIGQNANAGNFAYIPGYGLNSQAYVVGGVLSPGFQDPGFASPDITWYSQQSFNTGFDFSALHNKLNGSLDYFYYRTKNYLVSPSNTGYTDPLGTALPLVNSSTVAFRRAGIEFHLDYSDHIGDLQYSVGLNFTKFNQMWEVASEDSATLKNPYTRSSQVVGYNTTGFLTNGLYQNEDQILKNPHLQSSTNLQVGDIWYKDINGDGKIDNDDLRRIGNDPFPRANYGLSLDLRYKAWYFNMLWQGASKRDIYLSDVISNGTGFTYPFQQDYWRKDNTNALLPRAVSNTGVNGNNNTKTSDYWLVNGRYTRLKALQIGYDFKKGLFGKAGFFSDLRITLSGTNLLTFSPVKKFYMDPETGSTDNYDYPSQRVYSISVNVGF